MIPSGCEWGMNITGILCTTCWMELQMSHVCAVIAACVENVYRVYCEMMRRSTRSMNNYVIAE